jgi:hypothetical protein
MPTEAEKAERIAELEDIIGESSWCNDTDCSCHRAASEAREELEELTVGS